jgi:integrase/recombinase XerC
MELPFRDPKLLAFFKFLEIEKNFSIHTRKAYFFDIINFVENTWGEDLIEAAKLNWTQVNKDAALLYIFQLQQNKISKNTLLRKCSALRSLYNFLQREDVVKTNPFQDIKAAKKDKSLPVILSREDISKLLSAPHEFWENQNTKDSSFIATRDTAIFEIIYSGGLRIQEALNINFEHINLVESTLRILGKGKKQRIAYLGGPAKLAISNYFHCLKNLNFEENNHLPIFINLKNHHRLSARSVQRSLKIYLNFCQLPPDILLQRIYLTPVQIYVLSRNYLVTKIYLQLKFTHIFLLTDF